MDSFLVRVTNHVPGDDIPRFITNRLCIKYNIVMRTIGFTRFAVLRRVARVAVGQICVSPRHFSYMIYRLQCNRHE